MVGHVGRPMGLQDSLVIKPVRNGVRLYAVPLHFEENFNRHHRLPEHSAKLHHHTITNFVGRRDTQLLHCHENVVGRTQRCHFRV